MPQESDGRPSTDGTRLGADIAELFGTDDEREITRIGMQQLRQSTLDSLTGMDEEQRDWEEGDED